MNRKLVVGATLIFCLGVVAGPVSAQILRQLLKVGAFVVIADRFGPQIDRTLNSVTRQRHLGRGAATKVVPILSVGEGKFIGIVQVAGPRAAVNRTQAVAQLETRLPFIGGSRARILVPINVRSVTNMRRVSGVGVSAVIDVRL